MILNLFLYKDFDAELVESAGEALLELVTTHRQGYQEIVTEIMSSIKDVIARKQVQDGFGELEDAFNQVQGMQCLRGSTGAPKTWWREWDKRLVKFLTKARGVTKVL